MVLKYKIPHISLWLNVNETKPKSHGAPRKVLEEIDSLKHARESTFILSKLVTKNVILMWVSRQPLHALGYYTEHTFL